MYILSYSSVVTVSDYTFLIFLRVLCFWYILYAIHIMPAVTYNSLKFLNYLRKKFLKTIKIHQLNKIDCLNTETIWALREMVVYVRK